MRNIKNALYFAILLFPILFVQLMKWMGNRSDPPLLRSTRKYENVLYLSSNIGMLKGSNTRYSSSILKTGNRETDVVRYISRNISRGRSGRFRGSALSVYFRQILVNPRYLRHSVRACENMTVHCFRFSTFSNILPY